MMKERPHSYGSYKDSGVDWLGEVPEHWCIRPARSLFREIRDQDHPGEQLLSVTIMRGVIRQSELLSDTSKKDSSNLDKSKYKLAQPGDIAYNKMRAWQGAVGASNLRGIVSPAYVVERPRDGVLARYMHYLLRTPGFAKEAERWSYGITSDQWSLRPEHFKMIYFALPPIEEQAAIVKFLAHADQSIHQYILVKQKLIKLLVEYRQNTIQRVITNGARTNSGPTYSGMEWINHLPDAWRALRLHYLLDPSIPLTYGILLPGPRLDHGVPYLGAGDVRPDRLHLESLPRTTQEIASAYPRTKMRAGELVYAIRGSFGSVEVVPPELEGVNLSRDAARLAPRKNIDPHWLALALKAPLAQEQFALKEIGATITGVNIRDLKRVILPVPPPEEQEEIVRVLTNATDSLERAIAAAEREIALLREYRTRLFTDVVTGKTDVREVAENLSDKADDAADLELEDETLDQMDDAEMSSDELPEEETMA